MNIWIDGYEANVPQRLGSSQVAFELIKNIEKLDKRNSYTVLLPNPPLSDLPSEREGFKYKILKPKRLWTRIALPIALFSARKRPDLIFSPTHYIPRFAPKMVKRVVTIFDLAPLLFPQMYKKEDLYKLTKWTKYSIENSNYIITISQFSKKEIIKFFKTPKEKITVAYPGFNNLMHPIKDNGQIEKILAKYNIDQNYIIFIGTIQPKKNLIRLIEAFTKIETLKLVVVGKIKGEGRQAWLFEDILKRPKELGSEDKIIFTGFVPDEDMLYLLNGAVAFILPSLWEGFGIPVVDAMACGVPVLVSDVSSLPEVAGQAGLTFNPNSIDQIEQSIRLISSDKKLHAKLAKKSLEQAKKFSWEKMAKEVIKVLENV
jgi:glycosyltransferase involved in cell wall biosynthesis